MNDYLKLEIATEVAWQYGDILGDKPRAESRWHICDIAKRIIDIIMTVVGRIRGSLAVATIASASTFGAMSGSSVACVAAIGKLTLPSLQKAGYRRSFGVSLITATGVIDVIIPPSIPMIIYSIAAQQSAAILFLAGIVPGLIVACALSAYVMIHARIEMIPVGDPARWVNIWEAMKRSVWAVFAPVVILGGLDSIGGALVGGLIIGIVESLAAGYLDPYVGGGTKDFAPYVLMILVLMIRPYGIFGKRKIERV